MMACGMRADACGAAGTVLDDLYVLNLSTLAWANMTGAVAGPRPPARFGHGLFPIDGALYMLGGEDADGILSVHCRPPSQNLPVVDA